jgi:para-nitrobenzyl esterase
MKKILLCSLAGLVAATGVTPTAQSQAPSTVAVDTGELQGVLADGVLSFKGVPFAAPPVGELRWRPPQPAARWTGVRQAAEFGASCMQGRGFGPPPGAGARGAAPSAPGTPPAPAAPGTPPAPAPTPAGPPAAQAPSEDCLYLNVWRPADPAARNLPVMVWFYGGGFVGGSSSSPNTSGVGFAKHGAILVSLNYRVGRFGFFASRP